MKSIDNYWRTVRNILHTCIVLVVFAGVAIGMVYMVAAGLDVPLDTL